MIQIHGGRYLLVSENTTSTYETKMMAEAGLVKVQPVYGPDAGYPSEHMSKTRRQVIVLGLLSINAQLSELSSI